MGDPKKTCTDCGCRPQHALACASYCRQCAEKGGDRRSFVLLVDRDKVIQYFGAGMLERLEQDAEAEFWP